MELVKSPACFSKNDGFEGGSTPQIFWLAWGLGGGFRHHFLSSVFVLLKVPQLVLVSSLPKNCHAKTDGEHSSYKMRNLMFVLSRELARQRKEPAILPSSAGRSEMSRAAISETWKTSGTLNIKAKAGAVPVPL